MRDERRETRGGSRRDTRLVPGLIVSALLHLVLVLVDPGTVAPRHGSRTGSAPSTPTAQFTVLALSPRDDEERMLVEIAPTTTPRRTPPSRSPSIEGDDSGRDARPGENREPTVAERLRYNTRPFSPPVAPERETEHQRAVRETGERLLAASEELGPLPPNRVSPRRSSGGISIPFGFKPPPPAQTVPAPPLPDSILRRDSIRAAVHEAARRDSIRAARDTTKLRNVAPRKRVVIPRVVPDTTAET